jgi:hypothetical protein
LRRGNIHNERSLEVVYFSAANHTAIFFVPTVLAK